MNVNLENKMKEKDFAEKFVSFKTIDEVKEFVKSEGLDLSTEEIKQAGEEIKAAITQITPEELATVAGGRRGRGGRKKGTATRPSTGADPVAPTEDEELLVVVGPPATPATNFSWMKMSLWGAGAAAAVLACYAIYNNWDKIKAWWKS